MKRFILVGWIFNKLITGKKIYIYLVVFLGGYVIDFVCKNYVIIGIERMRC